MHLSQRKEQFSRAYIQAVAAVAGYAHYEHSVDDDSIDMGALITLLCYILAIHGRIAGWWGQFGMAVASVVCFAAVVMASYGVNYVLGKGLHSYGRGVGGEGYVVVFLVFEAAYLALPSCAIARSRA